jgi:hypothetical protein
MVSNVLVGFRGIGEKFDAPLKEALCVPLNLSKASRTDKSFLNIVNQIDQNPAVCAIRTIVCSVICFGEASYSFLHSKAYYWTFLQSA